MINSSAIQKAYYLNKLRLLDAGFSDELNWQEAICFDHLTLPSFLREYSWVVLNSGMKETVVRSKFSRIEEIFNCWIDPDWISGNADRCMAESMLVFGNMGKIKAIIQMAEYLSQSDWSLVKQQILCEGIDYLRNFSFIGPITSLHLAKNIGINVCKPDRHLVRVSRDLGFDQADKLCSLIASCTYDSKNVIDLVLWRMTATFPKRTNRYITVFNRAKV